MEHDHVVEALAPDGADQMFHKRILPRRTGRNELLFQAQGGGSRIELQPVNAVTITEEIAGWAAKGKSLGELLCGPLRRGRIGYIEVKHLATFMGQNQEHVEHPEGGRWDGKKVHRNQLLSVVLEEASPGLVAAVAAGSGTILADG